MNARQAKALPRCSAVCTTTRRRASYRASRGDVSSHGYCVLATHMHSLLQLGALGAGGTGTVELMRHRDSGELVAVRFIERGPKVLLSRPRVPRRPHTHGFPRCPPMHEVQPGAPTRLSRHGLRPSSLRATIGARVIAIRPMHKDRTPDHRPETASCSRIAFRRGSAAAPAAAPAATAIRSPSHARR